MKINICKLDEFSLITISLSIINVTNPKPVTISMSMFRHDFFVNFPLHSCLNMYRGVVTDTQMLQLNLGDSTHKGSGKNQIIKFAFQKNVGFSIGFKMFRSCTEIYKTFVFNICILIKQCENTLAKAYN